MFFSYLKIAFRNIGRNKLLSAINILSLSFGVAACLLIYLFIQDERSFDAFHEKGDRIYRMDEVQSFPGTNTQNVALTMPGMGPALQRDYPEVEMFTRFYGQGKRLYVRDDNRIMIEKTVAVDSTFFQIFDFSLISGDPATVLNGPNELVLTQSVKEKFFPGEDAVGKTLNSNDQDWKVTGIMADVPENSHLQFDVLTSFETVRAGNPDIDEQFGSNFLTTYVLFQPNADVKALETKMPEFLSRCMPPDEGDTDDVNNYYKVFFQRLPDVHLASMDIEHDYHNYREFNGQFLGVFGLVALIIILIASVNFMNLVTARAAQRGKEVGVRKTIGAHQSQLFSQFVTESVLMSFLSFLIGLGVAFLFAPYLNQLIGRDLSMGYFFDHPLLLTAAFGITLVLGFLAGIYPAFYMASFDINKVLKGGESRSGKSLFRSSLVVLQFGLAVGMIISTLVVVQQLMFIRDKDIGYSKDHILLVDLNEDANEVYSTLKSELKNSPNVLGVTAAGQRLGNNFHQWGFKMRTDTVRGLTPSNVNVDFDYLEVYDMDLVAGRGFDESRPRDNGYAFVINESLATELGVSDPIGISAGHAWYPDDSLGTVIGVVRDFNFNSLHYKINTLSLVVHPEWGYSELSVKLKGDNLEAGIAEVERVWTQLVPGWPFQYSFLDEHFDELYRSEQQMKAVVTIMAILAILIACMGLFGLAAISTEQRTKEIGIRKVLGASVGQIMLHLSKNFALLVSVAFVLFSPVTYLLMTKWLGNYAERITIGPIVFIIGFVLAFLISIGTVTYHTLRSATSNPVMALRDE